MQITPEQHDDLLELHVQGRLDNEWAATLDKAIDDGLRQGYHSLLVDLSGVVYASSAGLGVLTRAHSQFRAIRGFFGVGGAKGSVADVIRLTGLSKLLLVDLETVRATRGGGQSTISMPGKLALGDDVEFLVYDRLANASMSCEVFGDPTRFESGSYLEADMIDVPLSAETSAIGLGALGSGFAECSSRFGELLAVQGNVAQLSASGSGMPDYQTARGEFVPQAAMLYGLTWTGTYERLVRFDGRDPESRIELHALVDDVLTLTECEAAAVVIVAETAGLVGASLRKSPVHAASSNRSRFDHPEVRDWLFFTPERSLPHTLAVVAGIAARTPLRNEVGILEPFLRPLSRESSVLGHFHAAAFPFRPFKKRQLQLGDTVNTLFDAEQLEGLLHLVHDEREFSGTGDSEFIRGACWVAPLKSVTRRSLK